MTSDAPDTLRADSALPSDPARPRVVIVTGPSGAGRSTAIAALEDLGFEAIDNLPISLLPRVLAPGAVGRPLALGLDARNRDFGAPALIATVEALQAREDVDGETLYLDCRAEVLLRRYAETRRRHPAAPSEDPAAGIAREARLLADLRERASSLIDTSEMTPHDLRAALAHAYGPRGGAGCTLALVSFSYRRGIPGGVDTALDCRFLRNPHWEPALRELWGTDPRVAAHVAGDPRWPAFLDRVLALLRLTVPAHAAEGRRSVTIGLGCTGGQHRSVAVVEALAQALAGDGMRVSKKHHELDRRAAAGTLREPRGPGSDRASRGVA